MNLELMAYMVLVVAVSAQRVWELGRSKKNTQALLNRGAYEVGAEHYPIMAALHTLWLLSCVAEAFVVGEAPSVLFAAVGLTLLCVGQALRIGAIRTLGPRWTTRIIILPDAPVVASGIFKYIRHPNYLGVILEIAALPMVFGCWRTALGFSAANGALLWVRIRAEEKALSTENDYAFQFENRNRFLPKG